MVVARDGLLRRALPRPERTPGMRKRVVGNRSRSAFDCAIWADVRAPKCVMVLMKVPDDHRPVQVAMKSHELSRVPDPFCFGISARWRHAIVPSRPSFWLISPSRRSEVVRPSRLRVDALVLRSRAEVLRGRHSQAHPGGAEGAPVSEIFEALADGRLHLTGVGLLCPQARDGASLLTEAVDTTRANRGVDCRAVPAEQVAAARASALSPPHRPEVEHARRMLWRHGRNMRQRVSRIHAPERLAHATDDACVCASVPSRVVPIAAERFGSRSPSGRLPRKSSAVPRGS